MTASPSASHGIAKRVLIVESDPEISGSLHSAISQPTRLVEVVASAADANTSIASALPSVAVLDLVLPDADGRMLLRDWRSSSIAAGIPVVVLAAGASSAEIRRQCTGLGVSGFFEKPVDLESLASVVDQLLEGPPVTVDSGVDSLTGVASRAALCDAYKRLTAAQGAGVLSLALLDVDRFRSVNESCGADSGDDVLRGIAQLIGTSTASGQVVGRWQGDQFVALLPGVPQEGAAEWLERCLEALRGHTFTSRQGGTFDVTFSAGVIEAAPGSTIDDSVGKALGLLYRGKEGGRERVVTGSTELEDSSAVVLLADDDDIVAAIARNALEGQGLVVERCADGVEALEIAASKRVSLFLLDLNMPRMDGLEVLTRLRANEDYSNVPIAMLTAAGDEETVSRSMAAGADDFLIKPISSHELVARVRRLQTRWVEGRLHELQGSGLYMRGIDLLNRVFEDVEAERSLPVKDLSVLTLKIVAEIGARKESLLGQVMNPTVFDANYLAQHSLNSAILATIVGQELGLEGDDLDWLCVAALLHEVGCLRLPEGLLQRSEEISDDERAIIRRRPEFSHEIIRELAPEYDAAAEIALQVHERPDGSGYPKGLEGDEISLEAQILGAVEVFEALTHNRPYRDQPQAASEAVNYLLEAANTQFLDRVLKALISKIGLYPVGSYVALGSGETALVLEHREENPMRPLLAVVADRAGWPLPRPRVTDPMLNPLIHIKSSVAPPEIGA